jgi:PTS system nitrogen regulatory IIA component
MKLSECIPPENVEIDLNAPSKTRLLQILAEKASRSVGIDDREIFSALQSREKLGSTGIGAAVAIPHALVAGVK